MYDQIGRNKNYNTIFLYETLSIETYILHTSSELAKLRRIQTRKVSEALTLNCEGT